MLAIVHLIFIKANVECFVKYVAMPLVVSFLHSLYPTVLTAAWHCAALVYCSVMWALTGEALIKSRMITRKHALRASYNLQQ